MASLLLDLTPPVASHAGLARFTMAVMLGEVYIGSAYAGELSGIRADALQGWSRLEGSVDDGADDLVHPVSAVELALGWRSDEPDAVAVERLGWFIATSVPFRVPLARAVGRRMLYRAGAATGDDMVELRHRVLQGVRAAQGPPGEHAGIEQLVLRSVQAAVGERIRGRVDDLPVSQLCLIARAFPGGGGQPSRPRAHDPRPPRVSGVGC